MLRTAKHINRFMLFFLLQFIIIQELLSFAVVFFEIETDMYSYQTFGYPMVVLPPIVLYFTLTNQKLKNTLHLMPLGVVNLVLVVIMAITFQPILMVLSSLSSLFFPNSAEALVSSFLYVPLGALIFSLAVMPAVLEELVFRGICLNINLNMRMRQKVLLSAFFFAVIHLSPQQFLYAFAAGIYLALITYITRSILAPMLSHFTWNAFNVWVIYAGANADTVSSAGAQPNIAGVLISVVFILIITMPLFLFASYLLVINNLDKIVFEALSGRLRRIAEMQRKYGFAAAPGSAAPPPDIMDADKKPEDDDADTPHIGKTPAAPVITWEFWAIAAVYAAYVILRYINIEAPPV